MQFNWFYRLAIKKFQNERLFLQFHFAAIEFRAHAYQPHNGMMKTIAFRHEIRKLEYSQIQFSLCGLWRLCQIDSGGRDKYNIARRCQLARKRHYFARDISKAARQIWHSGDECGLHVCQLFSGYLGARQWGANWNAKRTNTHNAYRGCWRQ